MSERKMIATASVGRLGTSRRVREGYATRDLEQCLGEEHRKISTPIANRWLHVQMWFLDLFLLLGREAPEAKASCGDEDGNATAA